MSRRFVALGLAMMLVAIGGCSDEMKDRAHESMHSIATTVTPSDLNAKAVRSIKTVTVDRMAIMPLIDNPSSNAEPLAPGAADAITAELYSQATLVGGWEVVPEDDTVQALQVLPPSTPQDLDENALALGRKVSASGVLYGTVERYKERVGLDYAAAEPASVTFALKFVDLKTGEVVWQGRFAKSQKALSQNLFNLANFVQTSGRWVRAHEIAAEGVKEAVTDLHDRVTLASANAKRFEVRSYGQLKSGTASYEHGTPAGVFGNGQ